MELIIILGAAPALLLSWAAVRRAAALVIWARCPHPKGAMGSTDKMRFLALVAASSAAVFAVLLAWSEVGTAVNPESATDEHFPCTVTKVHDGDGPIWCAEGPKIRLTAIAARELDETCSPSHPCPLASGASAQQALQRLALGRTLQCEKTGTSYNRITAWCWRDDGLELNCAMVEGGWAARWDRYDPQNRMCR